MWIPFRKVFKYSHSLLQTYPNQVKALQIDESEIIDFLSYFHTDLEKKLLID